MKHCELTKCPFCKRATPITRSNGHTMCRRCKNVFFPQSSSKDLEIDRILDEILSGGADYIDDRPDDTSIFEMDVEEGIVYGVYDEVPENLVLPDCAKVIADTAFENAHIKTIQFNTGLLVIGEWSFSGTDIQSALLPDTLTTISSYAFLACGALESCIIPESVAFDPKAYHIFDMCYSLRKLSLPQNWLKEDGAVLDKVIGDTPARALVRIAQKRCPLCGQALNQGMRCEECRKAFLGTYKKDLSDCLL